jgi:hypothetical protein
MITFDFKKDRTEILRSIDISVYYPLARHISFYNEDVRYNIKASIEDEVWNVSRGTGIWDSIDRIIKLNENI